MNDEALYLLFYASSLVISLYFIVRAALKDFSKMRRRLRESGLSFKNSFFRLKPYDFWPEREISIKEAIKRGAISAVFLFSFTGILGTCIRWAGLSPLDKAGILCLALTVALMAFPLVTIIHYLNQYMLKRYGQPLPNRQDS